MEKETVARSGFSRSVASGRKKPLFAGYSHADFKLTNLWNYRTEKLWNIDPPYMLASLAGDNQKETETEHVFPHFHASRTWRTVWKDLKIMEANEKRAKGEWVLLYWSIEAFKILWYQSKRK